MFDILQNLRAGPVLPVPVLCTFFLIALVLLIYCIDSDLSSPDREVNTSGVGAWFMSIIALGCMLILIPLMFEPPAEPLRVELLALFLYCVLYFFIGTVWAFARWFLHLLNVRTSFVDFKLAFMYDNKITDTDVKSWGGTAVCEFAKQIQRRFRTYVNYDVPVDHKDLFDPAEITHAIKPVAARNKSNICQWIVFWPVSCVWTVIDDPIRRLVRFIFNSIKSTLQRMSDSIFEGL